MKKDKNLKESKEGYIGGPRGEEGKVRNAPFQKYRLVGK